MSNCCIVPVKIIDNSLFIVSFLDCGNYLKRNTLQQILIQGIDCHRLQDAVI